MVGVPTLLVVWLVWLPAIGSVLLSFTNWDGIGAALPAQVGRAAELPRRRHDLPAVLAGGPAQPDLARGAVLRRDPARHASSPCCSTGRSRVTRFYQTAIYLPVVLSLALVGFIWQLIYIRDQGLINAVTGRHDRLVRRPERQPLGGPGRGELAARRLHHAALPGRAQGRRPDPARGGQGRRRQRAADVLPGRLPGDARRSTSSSSSSPSSSRCAPSTWSGSSTRAATGSSSSRPW